MTQPTVGLARSGLGLEPRLNQRILYPGLNQDQMLGLHQGYTRTKAGLNHYQTLEKKVRVKPVQGYTRAKPRANLKQD